MKISLAYSFLTKVNSCTLQGLRYSICSLSEQSYHVIPHMYAKPRPISCILSYRSASACNIILSWPKTQFLSSMIMAHPGWQPLQPDLYCVLMSDVVIGIFTSLLFTHPNHYYSTYYTCTKQYCLKTQITPHDQACCKKTMLF